MKAKNWNWTEPYHGVSHLDRGQGTGMRPQFTIESYDGFTVAVHLPDNGRFDGPEKTFCGEGAEEQAKQWLEEQALLYD